MKIAIDIDEVLGNFLSEVIAFHNSAYGTDLEIGQFTSYRFWEIWGGTREQAIDKIYEFKETEYFRGIRPLPGAQKAITELKAANELCIVTSRQNEFIEVTRAWLDRYFPNCFSGVYFTNHYGHSESSITKAQICDQIGADLLIDDSLDFALECAVAGRQAILFDYPWNKASRLPEAIRRVSSWDEAVKIIESL